MLASIAVALSVALLAACTAAEAASPVTVELTKLQRTGTQLQESLAADRARAAFFMNGLAGEPTTVPVTNAAYSHYTLSVGIGSPPTYYNLIVDTGSSNTFCGAGIPYVRTSTSIPTGQSMGINYGSFNFTGPEYLDQVTLAPSLVIANQSIGDVSSDPDFEGADGVIGLGPVHLTRGTIVNDSTELIPTVMDNLVSQGLIRDEVLGVYFAPATSDNDKNGALTFGGVEPSLYLGELTYVPVTETRPAGTFWGINVTSTTYGTQTIIPYSTAGIVDMGITQILLATDFLESYMNAVRGATWDPQTNLIEIPLASIPQMQPLNFVIGGTTFVMDVGAQLFPQDEVGGPSTSGNVFGVVGDLGYPSGMGLDFVLGQKFIERYYTVFDTDAIRVGFAFTQNTFSVLPS